jgi:hypothetical protein
MRVIARSVSDEAIPSFGTGDSLAGTLPERDFPGFEDDLEAHCPVPSCGTTGGQHGRNGAPATDDITVSRFGRFAHFNLFIWTLVRAHGCGIIAASRRKNGERLPTWKRADWDDQVLRYRG